MEPYKQLLVPETIILSGRQGRHEDAMRLLTHGLGDYDTAVSYCVLGGASTYSSIAQQESQRRLPSHDEQEALFKFLLQEFLSISDLNERTTQTTELLGRFAGWFSIEHVSRLNHYNELLKYLTSTDSRNHPRKLVCRYDHSIPGERSEASAE